MEKSSLNDQDTFGKVWQASLQNRQQERKKGIQEKMRP